MTWAPVTSPTGGNSVSTTTFGIPVAGNMGLIGGPWVAYTPAITTGGVAISLGNGNIDAAVKQIDKTIFWRATLTVGSTTSMTAGTIVIGLPVSARATTAGHAVGSYATGGPNGEGTWRNVSQTTVQLYSGGTLQTVATLGLVSGSILLLNGTYEAA